MTLKGLFFLSLSKIIIDMSIFSPIRLGVLASQTTIYFLSIVFRLQVIANNEMQFNDKQIETRKWARQEKTIATVYSIEKSIEKSTTWIHMHRRLSIACYLRSKHIHLKFTSTIAAVWVPSIQSLNSIWRTASPVMDTIWTMAIVRRVQGKWNYVKLLSSSLHYEFYSISLKSCSVHFFLFFFVV